MEYKGKIEKLNLIKTKKVMLTNDSIIKGKEFTDWQEIFSIHDLAKNTYGENIKKFSN